MSDVLFTYSPGEFATARRGSVVADIDFIRERRRAGYPISAIARMVSRNEADVAKLCETLVEPAPEREPLPALYAVPREPEERRRPAESRAYVWPREMPPRAKCFALESCALRGVSLGDVVGDNNTRQVAHARQEVYWRLSKAGYNNCEIGSFIGGRDPSTVRHGIKAHIRRFWLGEP